MRSCYSLAIIFLAIVSLMFACESVPINNGHYINGFKYDDPSYQKEIIDELKKNGIPIIISDNGYVSYPADYVNAVKIVLKRLDNKPYSEFYEKRYVDKFVEILEGNNLEYKIKYLESNKVQVYWDIKDDILVRELKKKNLHIIFYETGVGPR